MSPRSAVVKTRSKTNLGLIGNSAVQTYLQKATKSGIVPHAQLWVGPEHVGKTTFLENYFDQLQVKRAVAVRYYDGAELDMDAARGLIKETTETSLWSGRRFIVIQQAQKLRYQVYNALLKVLEEPRGQICVIFLATHLESIPATVQSRCITLWFQRVSDAELQAALPDQVDLVALAQGLPGRLVSWRKGTVAQKWVQQLVQWAQLLQQSPAERISRAVEKDLAPVLVELETTLYSLLSVQMQARHYPAALQAELDALASRIQLTDTTNALQQVAMMRRSLERPVQPKLVMTNLLLNMYTQL